MNRFRARAALSAAALLGVLGGLPGLAACSSGTPSSAQPPGAKNGPDGLWRYFGRGITRGRFGRVGG